MKTKHYDIDVIRRSIREGWPVTADQRAAAIGEIMALLHDAATPPRVKIRAVLTLLQADKTAVATLEQLIKLVDLISNEDEKSIETSEAKKLLMDLIHSRMSGEDGESL